MEHSRSLTLIAMYVVINLVCLYTWIDILQLKYVKTNLIDGLEVGTA